MAYPLASASRMLAGIRRPAEALPGEMAQLTVEKVAINAIMVAIFNPGLAGTRNGFSARVTESD